MTQRVDELFRDAEGLYRKALQELEAGDLRQAAEKAWGATLRATAALIRARTGQEPERSVDVTRALNLLAGQDERIERLLVPRYFTRQSSLHGDCFYHGELEPCDVLERRIRETEAYIRDAREAAAQG